MNTYATEKTEEFLNNIYSLINLSLNKKNDLDLEYFDTFKLLTTTDNTNIQSMMSDICNKQYKLVYSNEDNEAFEYGNYFGDINILVDGELKYIIEMVLGKEYVDNDYVGLNIYSKDWKARIN